MRSDRRRKPRASAHHRAGLTLIEVLVALTIFAITVSMVSGPLLFSIRATINSRATQVSTTSAQNLLEQVRSSWRERVAFNAACANLTLPAGATMENQALSLSQLTTGTTSVAWQAVTVGSCAPTPNPPPVCTTELRRVRINVNPTQQGTLLSLDIPCPQ